FLDRTPPECQLFPKTYVPSKGDTGDDAWLSDAISGVRNVHFFMDGKLRAAYENISPPIYTPRQHFGFIATTIGQGNHTFSVKCEDSVGNTSSDAITVIADEPPLLTLSIISQSSGLLQYRIQAVDPDGLINAWSNMVCDHSGSHATNEPPT